MENKVEKYDTVQKEVRRWLIQIVKTFENPEMEYPVLVHCLSGKDRTGIVIATLLTILGVDCEVVIEEYLLSEGEVKREWIEQALDGLGKVEAFFDAVDLALVRRNLLASQGWLKIYQWLP